MTCRVLYLCGGRSFYSRQPGRKIASVAECWRRMGHEVLHVYGGDILEGAGERKAPEYGAVSFHRQWYRRIGILDPLIRSVSERRDIQHDAAMVRRLKQVCESFKPDVIWERSCRLHCAGLVTAQRLGVPYVLEWKDNIASYWLSWYRNRARTMERRKNQESDFIVTESEVLRDQLIREGIDAQKIISAQNAVDPNDFRRDVEARKRVRHDLGVTNDIVLVGYLGGYWGYHNTSLLVQAMSALEGMGIRNVKCLMLGAGKQSDKTRHLAEKSGLLGSKIIMKPGVPKDEVPDILAAVDIAVLPGSTDIICPIKIQEYMASELPTLAPDYACNREVVDDGRTGILFAPKDKHSLARTISLLAQDSELRVQLGRAARQEVMEHFTWEKTWGAALETVLRGGK